MILYRASNKPETVFVGMHFSDDPEMAQDYADFNVGSGDSFKGEVHAYHGSGEVLECLELSDLADYLCHGIERGSFDWEDFGIFSKCLEQAAQRVSQYGQDFFELLESPSKMEKEILYSLRDNGMSYVYDLIESDKHVLRALESSPYAWICFLEPGVRTSSNICKTYRYLGGGSIRLL